MGGRVLGDNEAGWTLTQIMAGAMLFWDTPTGLAVASLREPLMLMHHILLFFTTVFGRRAYHYYACCFFGVVELSSLPLVAVDLFHPKHPQWHQLAEAGLLKTVNELARYAFASAFLLARAFYFPYVVFTQVVPDVLAVFSCRLRKGMASPLWKSSLFP